MRSARGFKVAAVLVALSAYVGISYYCNATEALAARRVGIILGLVPLMTLSLTAAGRAAGAVGAGVALAGAALALAGAWPLLETHATLPQLIDELVLYGALAVAFGRSLRADATPLCTRFADQIHGPLTPEELRYTRSVTRAWTMFFATMTTLTFILYLGAPPRLWLKFVDFGIPPLILLMFLAEYAVRVRLLEPRDRHGLIASLKLLLIDPRSVRS